MPVKRHQQAVSSPKLSINLFKRLQGLQETLGLLLAPSSDEVVQGIANDFPIFCVGEPRPLFQKAKGGLVQGDFFRSRYAANLFRKPSVETTQGDLSNVFR